MALRKRTDTYWQKRANERLLKSERLTKKYMAELSKVYAEARRRTVKELQDIYAAYYKGDKGFDMQALRSIVPTGEIKKLLSEMKKLGLSTNMPENYAGRVQRLEFINEQLRLEAQKIAIKQQTTDEKALRSVYEGSYYRAGYDVARGIGSTPVGFSRLDTQTINQVMGERFKGENFSDRVWSNTDILANRLQKTLAVAIANGQGIQKTSREMRKEFNTNQYYAERLIRTESNHFHNEGELEAYKQMGFEKYQFLATLDSRTSEICQEMDGKVFEVSKGIPGDNVPPLHPNCRSTIVPYFKGYEPETRLYRDPGTSKNKFVYNVSYAKWAESVGLPSYANPLPKLYNKYSMTGDIVAKQLYIKRGKPMSIKRAYEGANPSYSKGRQWKHNCQRCVCAYELRRRGYDVVAMPKMHGDKMHNGGEFFQDAALKRVSGLTFAQLEKQLMKAKPGARFIIEVRWPRSRVGHTFNAERLKKSIKYVDGQPGKDNAKDYFKRAVDGKISYFRSDNAKIDSKINVKAVVTNAK